MKWWQLKKRDADLQRELRSDLELEEEEQRENGLSAEEARFAARRAFGNATLIKGQTRETWGWAPFERLLQDIRYAFRFRIGEGRYPHNEIGAPRNFLFEDYPLARRIIRGFYAAQGFDRLWSRRKPTTVEDT